MKIQFKSDVTCEKSFCKRNGVTIRFDSWVSPFFEGLREGCDEALLVSCANNQDELLRGYYYLEELKKQAFLSYKTPLVTLVPFNGKFDLHQKLNHRPHYLSRLACLRCESGQIMIESPLSATRAYLTETGYALLHAFKQPILLDSVSHIFSQIEKQDLLDTILLLTCSQVIVTEEDPALLQWDFHDALFHTRSRKGRFDSPYGATFRFKGLLTQLPATKQCVSPTIPFQPPKNALKMTLEDVLNQRKSIREQGASPISKEQLGEFLWQSARVKKIFTTNGFEFSSRPYPGGGACYELEIYPIVHQCQGIESGIYHYHPLEHALSQIEISEEDRNGLLKEACYACRKKELPQLLILITARFQRVFWKYQSMGYALILKNLGVLLQTMCLVATALNLAPCILGGGGAEKFHQFIGSHHFEESVVGEFILGSPP